MRRSLVPLLLALSTLAAMPREALAGPPIPSDAPETNPEADALFHKGTAAFDTGKFTQAYQLYLAAWKLKQTHDIAGNLAQAEIKLGKTRDAAEHIAFALAHFPPSVLAQTDRVEKMKKALDELRKDLGTLHVRVNVEGAKVAVDGKVVGEAPLAGEVFVEAGAHVVEASAEGFVGARAQVDAAKGSDQEVALVLAEVRKVELPPPPVVAPKRSPIAGAVLGGVGGAAVLVGVALLVDLHSKETAASTLHDAILKAGQSCVTGAVNFDARCSQVQGIAEAGNRDDRAGIGLLIGGGLAAAGAVVYFLLPAPNRDASGLRSVHATPMVSATGAGMVLSGSF